LSGNEQVIVDGKQNLRPGGKVRMVGRQAGRCRPGRLMPKQKGSHMNLSELCIRRPVMTVLLSLSLVLAGVLAYLNIPVAALPSYNTPVINVSARDLPGAAPDTMASSVALPLEKQFSTIAGLKLITSTNTLGNSSLTLEFDPSATSTPPRSTCRPRCCGRSASCRSEMTRPAVVPQGQPGRCAGAVHRR
jgi:hypothetical protein